MTQINKGQSRAKEVHARNEQRYVQKHGHPHPGKGNKAAKMSDMQSPLTNPYSGYYTGLNSNEQKNILSNSSTSAPTASSSQNIPRARSTGGPNDTVAYLEGAVDDALDPQRLYRETYVA